MPSPQMASMDASFDHVAHAARSIRSMLPLYRDLLGGEFVGGGDNGRVGFRTLQLRYANGHRVELLEPLPGSTFLDSFFERRGEGGLHHLTFKVTDIGAALAAVEAAGLSPFGVFLDEPGWQEFFIHPRDAHGTVIQVAHSPHVFDADWRPPMTIDEFLERGGDYFGP